MWMLIKIFVALNPKNDYESKVVRIFKGKPSKFWCKYMQLILNYQKKYQLKMKHLLPRKQLVIFSTSRLNNPFVPNDW